jgi:surface antigen bspA-like
MDIPDSVESIGESAFKGCTALTSVNLPNSLASIEKSTFEGCSALASVVIPHAVTSIGENAFKSCSALQSIIIPSQVASVGQGAFSECGGLKKTLYPNTFDTPVYYGVKISYDPNDFSQEDGLAYNKDKSTLLFAPLSLTGECRVAASVDSIGEQAYAYCGKITSLTIPGNVRSIGNSAFEGCDGIKSVVLEDGASTLKMGNYITYDGRGTHYKALFSPCPLESIYVGRNLEYDVDGKDAPFARQSALGSVSFGKEINSISDEMFYGCTALVSIEFPETVESVGAFVFAGCTGLDNVVLPSSVNSIGKQAFDGCTGLKEISLPASLSSLSVGLFNGCTNLVKVVLPSSLEAIGNQAFNNCESLSEIVLPASLESIGRMAFYNCGNLKEIVLPASVSELGDGVFDGSTALSSIRCEGVNPPAISETSVSNQYDKARLFIPAGTISAYYSSLWRNFSNMNVGEYETKYYTDDVLKYLLVPDGTDHPSAIVVKGGYSALTEVTIPERFTDMSDPANPQRYYVTEIGYEAFKGLSNLQKVSFNSKSEASIIGESAFEGCKNLLFFSSPESLRRIENKAFYDCTLLFDFVFNEGLEYIGEYAFAKVLMGVITIPGSVKSIGDYAFSERNISPYYGAAYLQGGLQIVLGEGVETIGKGAFEIRSCGVLLDKVSLPKSLKSIGENAFSRNLCPRIEISDLSAWCDIDFGGTNANPTQYSSGDFPDSGYQKGYLYLNDKPVTDLVIPDGVKDVKSYAFNNLKTLKSVKFSDGVEEIGQSAFGACDGLEYIGFNDGLSSIGEYAFSGCKKVGEISLPSSLASISAGAFYNTGLNKVAIPAAVVELGRNAFDTVSEVTFEDGVNEIKVAGDFSNMKSLVWGRPIAGLTVSTKNLESLVIGNVADEVPESLCSGASNLSSLTLGSGLKSIGDNAFKGCKLSEVIVPPSVETIGSSAFESNNYLSSIIMGHSVASIGEKAFNGCAANTVSITAQTPPVAPNTTFSNYTGKLYLQGKNAVDAYYDAYTCWDRFSSVVMIEPTGLDVNEKVVTGKAGDTFQLSAKLMPENVTLPQVFWRSTNPAIATVDGNGLVTLHADVEDMLTRGEEYSCKIIAESLYYDGPVAEIGVNNLDSGVEDVIFDSENGAVRPNDVYNMQGVCVKRNATQEDIDSLAPGLYIIGGKKVMIR